LRRLAAALTAALCLVATASGCVTALSYKKLADVKPEVVVDPAPVEKLEAVSVVRPDAGAIVAFSATMREGERATFRGEIADLKAVRAEAAALDIGPEWPLPADVLSPAGGRPDPAAAKTARLDKGRVRLTIDGRPVEVHPARVSRDERTARRIIGWTGFILLLPLTVVADIITFPVQVLVLNP
jgi:hypothetical protein